MTDDSPRLKEAFRYMVYGKSKTFDVERMIDMLQALEKFVAVKDYGDGSAFKVDGIRGDTYVGTAGEAIGTKKVLVNNDDNVSGLVQRRRETSKEKNLNREKSITRDALKFFFNDDGKVFREFVLDEVSNGVDAISRDAVRELFIRLNIRGNTVPPLFKALAPKLTDDDKKVVDSITKLVNFLSGDFSLATTNNDPASRIRTLQSLIPTLREFAPNMRTFALQIISRLVEKSTSRLLRATADQIFA